MDSQFPSCVCLDLVYLPKSLVVYSDLVGPCISQSVQSYFRYLHNSPLIIQVYVYTYLECLIPHVSLP